MVKRFPIRASAFALAAQLVTVEPAPAQTFPKPTDVADYISVTPQYKTDGTANAPVDPSVAPPPVAELANIPVPSEAGRVTAAGPYGPGDPYCTVIADGGTCNEYKFRTSIDFSYMLADDPIRNYGQPGQSHLHCFAGAGSANANSTYKTLRNHALDSKANGKDVNGTGYWRPCTVLLNPFSNGNNYALMDDSWTVYYVGAIGVKTTHLPVGIRFVWGFDMDSSSPTNQYAWLKSTLDAANAVQGRTRYTLANPSTGKMSTQVSYVCTGATPSEAGVFKTAGGTDPYGGTCASGATFYAKIDGPNCWDGKNLWSPGGYKHLIPQIWDADYSKFVCPYNYYQTPTLRIEFLMTQYGWTDRQRWDLSSDIAYRAAKGLTMAQLPPGTTFHTDWLDGWDHAIFNLAQRNCSGADAIQGHECNSSIYSSTKGLVSNVDFSSVDHTTQAGMMLIPPAWSGSLTNMHIHQ